MSLPKMPLAGVIGYPIAHSKSPKIHGHWLSPLGIQGADIPMEEEPANLKDVIL